MALCGVFSGSAHAVTLASYVDGTDQDANALLNLTTPSGFSVTSLSYDNNDAHFVGNETDTKFAFHTSNISSGQWIRYIGRDSQADATLAFDSSYLQFTLTADGGNQLDLDTVSFDFAVGNRAKYVVGQDVTGGYQLYYSTDAGANFSTAGSAGSLTAFGTANIVDDVIEIANVSYDLSGIANTDSVIFRVGFSDNTGNVDQGIAFQNIQALGSVVAVPEPSAAILGLLGALLLLRRRRCS